MSVTSRYRESWEGFWREAPDGQGEVFWDAEPALTAVKHLPLLDPLLADRELPLLDLGCGNGTQTRFFAQHFARVMGADLSAAAIGRARSAAGPEAIDYRVLDAVDPAGVEGLHAEVGDVNLYMRGVLHQCDPDDRQPLLHSVATLLGESGRALLVELAETARAVLMGAGAPPAKLEPVLRHGIAPGEVTDAAVGQYVREAGLTVLASGRLPLATTDYREDGTLIELPSNWLVVGRSD